MLVWHAAAGTTTEAKADIWSLLDLPGAECKAPTSAIHYVVASVCVAAVIFLCGWAVARYCRRRRLLVYGVGAAQKEVRPPSWMHAMWLMRKVDKAVSTAEQVKIRPRPMSKQLVGGPWLGSTKPDGRSVIVDQNGTQRLVGEKPLPGVGAAKLQKLREIHARSCQDAETVASWAAAAARVVLGDDRRKVKL